MRLQPDWREAVAGAAGLDPRRRFHMEAGRGGRRPI